MQSTLPIHSFLFNSNEFKVYGTHEEPLFLVNDVVCGLLGARDIANDRFFADNKNDSRYVNTLQMPGCCPELYERFKNSKKDYIYFFTEKGLYRRLMRSNKPVAELFQDEICDHLKNIRLGNVSIHINKIEELKQYIEEKDSVLSDVKKQVTQLKTNYIRLAIKRCNLYKFTVFDKNGVVIGEYGGSSNYSPQARENQHRYHSCNARLREAIEEGLRVEFNVVETFNYIDENVRKYKERDLIMSIEKEKRMNVYIPRVVSRSRYSREEEKESISNYIDDLTTVYETESTFADYPITLSNMNPHAKAAKHFGTFAKNVQDLADFIKTNKTYPQKRSANEDEARLGRFVDGIRQYLNNPTFKTSMPEDRRQHLFRVIPDFIQNEKEHHFTQTVKELASFIAENKRYPVGKKGQTNTEESRLAKFLAHSSSPGGSCGFYGYTPKKCLKYTQDASADEYWNEDCWYELRTALSEIKAFLVANSRLPKSNQNKQKSIPEEEIKLGFRLHNIRTSLKAQTIKPEVAQAKRDFINYYDPELLALIEA